MAALLAKIEELQKQIATLSGEVKMLKSTLTEGSSNDDVKKVQELLASDPTIYPEAKVTGYFGALTKEAIKRFQKRHELPETGIVDEETKALMEEYLKERTNGQVPPGLLRAPGIMKKVEDRMGMKCDNSGPGKGMGPLCERLKKHHEMDDEDRMMKKGEKMEDDDDDSDDDTSDDDSDVRTSVDAGKAIRDANEAIMKASREIRKSRENTNDAIELLDQARAKRAEAQKARAAGDFDAAVESAEEAENLADDARTLAQGDKLSDDEDDDSDDEDEDDDEDESDDDSDDEEAEDDEEDS
jgi:prefoldin subunit 5